MQYNETELLPVDKQNGLLLVDKPIGISSNRCVQRVRSLLGVRKAGHTGTLDPAATGLLPICCGKATRLSEFLLVRDKSYQATIRLGVKTDTGDTEGQIIKKSNIPLISQSQLETLAQDMIGVQTQVPPLYSAIKVKGKPMYSWAREQKHHTDLTLPDLQSRKIEIYSLTLGILDREHISMLINCSKGTYIRSLAETIAARLDTVGHLSQLRRTACGNLTVDKALTLSHLEKPGPDLTDSWMSVEEMVSDMPHFSISAQERQKITNGIPLKLPNKNLRGIIALMSEAKLVALAKADEGRGTLAPVKVFSR